MMTPGAVYEINIEPFATRNLFRATISTGIPANRRAVPGRGA
jgi:hypothetical protein